MTMGTAATMMAVAEALGFTLPGVSSIPAPDSNHPRAAKESGRRIVEMVWDDLKPSDIITKQSVDNAIKVHMAMAGSTNCIIHLIAIARRAGIPLEMSRFDELSREVPVIANVRPSGAYLMEDFFYAGGLRGLMSQLRSVLDLSAMTVTGKTVGDNIEGAEVYKPDVIKSLNDPVSRDGATAVLTGNLAPRGAVIKHSAASERLWPHTGRAASTAARSSRSRITTTWPAKWSATISTSPPTTFSY